MSKQTAQVLSTHPQAAEAQATGCDARAGRCGDPGSPVPAREVGLGLCRAVHPGDALHVPLRARVAVAHCAGRYCFRCCCPHRGLAAQTSVFPNLSVPPWSWWRYVSGLGFGDLHACRSRRAMAGQGPREPGFRRIQAAQPQATRRRRAARCGKARSDDAGLQAAKKPREVVVQTPGLGALDGQPDALSDGRSDFHAGTALFSAGLGRPVHAQDRAADPEHGATRSTPSRSGARSSGNSDAIFSRSP